MPGAAVEAYTRDDRRILPIKVRLLFSSTVLLLCQHYDLHQPGPKGREKRNASHEQKAAKLALGDLQQHIQFLNKSPARPLRVCGGSLVYL